MSMTVTIVVTVSDTKFAKSKHATATAGQEASFSQAGRVARDAVAKQLGGQAVSNGSSHAPGDVVLTSVTVA